MGNFGSAKFFFDFEFYLRENDDLKKVFGCDRDKLWEHWLCYGKHECRDHRFSVHLAAACRNDKKSSSCTVVPTFQSKCPTNPEEETCKGCKIVTICDRTGYAVAPNILLQAAVLTKEQFFIANGLDSLDPESDDYKLAETLFRCVNGNST